MDFDHSYYQRYYFDPRTAVASRCETEARARLIAAFAAHVGLPVRRILDAGCGVLYFSALTRADYQENCDRTRTDGEVHLRSGRWYRAQLTRQFREAGLGFWLRRSAPLTLWELESK